MIYLHPEQPVGASPAERACHAVLILGPLFGFPVAGAWIGRRYGDGSAAAMFLGIATMAGIGTWISVTAAGLIKTNNL